MHSFYINVHTAQEVQEFIDIACTYPFDITVSDGSRSFNGKSLMGYFCLDPSHPMKVTACCSDEDFAPFFQAVDRFRSR